MSRPLLAVRAILTASCLWLLTAAAWAMAEGAPAASALRIVSLNPSLTAIVLALGAQHQLVGVDDYSAEQNRVLSALPRVGGLFSPSLEAVVALRPDVVVLVPSAEQRGFRDQLRELGVRVSAFENISFDQVLDNVERLGEMLGRQARARERIDSIERTRSAVSRVTAGRPSPRALVVLQRDPLFVVGSGSFLAEMLVTLRAKNLAGEFDEPYPRVAVEWVVARSPEVLIDLSLDAEPAIRYWARWPSLSAVRTGRVLQLDPALISMPGPHLDRSLELLAEGLYGEEVLAQIEALRGR